MTGTSENRWWFREVLPNCLTLTYGQLTTGSILAAIGFILIITLSVPGLHFVAAIWVAGQFFDLGVKSVKSVDKTEAEDAEDKNYE